MKLYRIAKYQYQEIGLEDDSDLYGQGEEVFNAAKIRPHSSSEIRDVVVDKGQVIGALSEEWDTSNADILPRINSWGSEVDGMPTRASCGVSVLPFIQTPSCMNRWL